MRVPATGPRRTWLAATMGVVAAAAVTARRLAAGALARARARVAARVPAKLDESRDRPAARVARREVVIAPGIHRQPDGDRTRGTSGQDDFAVVRHAGKQWRRDDDAGLYRCGLSRLQGQAGGVEYQVSALDFIARGIGPRP